MRERKESPTFNAMSVSTASPNLLFKVSPTFVTAMKRLGSSPPSPVLDLPPMRFIATAKVACASVEMDPSDIAPVANRVTISFADSTSSIGTGAPADLISNMPRNVIWRLVWSLIICAYSLYVEYEFALVECCNLAIASGVHMCSSPRTR